VPGGSHRAPRLLVGSPHAGWLSPRFHARVACGPPPAYHMAGVDAVSSQSNGTEGFEALRAVLSGEPSPTSRSTSPGRSAHSTSSSGRRRRHRSSREINGLARAASEPEEAHEGLAQEEHAPHRHRHRSSRANGHASASEPEEAHEGLAPPEEHPQRVLGPQAEALAFAPVAPPTGERTCVSHVARSMSDGELRAALAMSELRAAGKLRRDGGGSGGGGGGGPQQGGGGILKQPGRAAQQQGRAARQGAAGAAPQDTSSPYSKQNLKCAMHQASSPGSQRQSWSQVVTGTTAMHRQQHRTAPSSDGQALEQRILVRDHPSHRMGHHLHAPWGRPTPTLHGILP
jgi:hypothetical protein